MFSENMPARAHVTCMGEGKNQKKGKIEARLSETVENNIPSQGTNKPTSSDLQRVLDLRLSASQEVPIN